MSRIRANQITNQSADGAPTVQNGLVISGVTTSTTFSGSGASLTNLPAAQLTGALPAIDGSNLTNITSTTINNNADNRVITGSGTANTLEGEANLTWDGSQLYVNCGNYSEPILINSVQSSVRATIRQTNNANANTGLAIQKRHSSLHPANHWYGDISFEGWDGSGYHKGGLIECVASGTPANDNMPGELRFSTNSGGTNPSKILTITSGGNVRHTGGGNDRRYTFSSDDSAHYISFDNSLNGIKLNGYGGIKFETNGTNERLRITSGGQVCIGTDTAVRALTIKQPGQIHLESTDTGNWLGVSLKGSSGTNNYNAYFGMLDSNGNFFIDNGSNGNDFVITQSGQVTKPSQASFAVGKSGNAYTINNGVLPFDATRHNTGSHFNTGNYRFTAPVAGKYLFTFHSIVNGSVNNGQQHYDIRINNSVSRGMSSHFSNLANNDWDQVSSSYIFELSENDYVTMYSVSNTGWHGNDWQLFCGQLLS